MAAWIVVAAVATLGLFGFYWFILREPILIMNNFSDAHLSSANATTGLNNLQTAMQWLPIVVILMVAATSIIYTHRKSSQGF